MLFKEDSKADQFFDSKRAQAEGVIDLIHLGLPEVEAFILEKPGGPYGWTNELIYRWDSLISIFHSNTAYDLIRLATIQQVSIY